jgi:hypothetical protein
MSGIPEEKKVPERVLDVIGQFFGWGFEYATIIYDALEKTFDVLEKAFDRVPLIGPLIVLALIGMLTYYVLFFSSFNAWNMLVFTYLFVGGIILLALIILYKFAETFEPYLLHRAATKKIRENNQRMLDTHRIIRQVIKKKSEHKEISANDVLIPAKDKKNRI